MADAYWRFAAAEAGAGAGGGLPPTGGVDPGRDFPGYLPYESSQAAARDFPGYLPRENSQPTGRDFPGYLTRENSQFDDRIGHSVWRTHDPLGPPLESLRDGISPYRAVSLNASEIGGSGVGLGGVPGGTGSARMTAPILEDPVLLAQRQGGVSMDPARAGRTAGSEFYNTRSDASLRLLDGTRPDASSRLPENLRPDATTNTLFVEGLPTDCTRREVAHIFRPFIGFKQIRVIHKEPRRAGGEPYVLCFVEFTDDKCAATALKALQGYKFDDVDHDSNPLKLQFAHFPGSRPIVAPVYGELSRAVS